jgi:hypothetical protein
MIISFAEDFSTDLQLDSELFSVPTSGLFFNRGVHPVVNLKNMMSLLPIESYTFPAYVAGTTYGKYESTQKRTDIVTSNGLIYESIAAANLGNTPATASTKWLLTNLKSLRVKSFVKASRDSMISALNLTRKLVENQYIYNVGENTVLLSGNYSGWAIEPKGSDYIKIRINQIALQANTTSSVSLYVVNQGVLLTTLTLTPVNGVLTFESVPYEIVSKGRVILAFASQSVRTSNSYNDALKFNGLVAYPVEGIGSTAALSTWENCSAGNGLNFNLSAYFDSGQYVTNNLIDFAHVWQAQFEMDFIKMLLNNVNVRINATERNMDELDANRLYFEITDLQNNTVARRYNALVKDARAIIARSFDRALQNEDDSLDVTIGTI